VTTVAQGAAPGVTTIAQDAAQLPTVGAVRQQPMRSVRSRG
jgi:hypothetical protein